MSQTHTWSTTLYDISWQDIGNAVESVESLDNVSGVSISAKYDTSGGTRDDGTPFSSEAVVTVTMEYPLGTGDTALESLANALSNLSVVSKSVPQLKTEIKARG